MKTLIDSFFRKSSKGADSDLRPRGVSKTVAELRTDFNSTFEHMRVELDRSYKYNRLP